MSEFSVSVIICELTGQLAPILPVLIAMLIGNAICKFLQPSIYESIIRIKKYPYLPDLPPSRISVYTIKVEQLMICDVIYITKDMTYRYGISHFVRPRENDHHQKPFAAYPQYIF